MTVDVLKTFSQLHGKLAMLNGMYQQAQIALVSDTQSRDKLKEDQIALAAHQEVLQDAIANTKVLIDKLSINTVRSIESFVTQALRTIFFDRDYSFEIRTSDKRNTKYAELYLKEGDNEFSIHNSLIAGGVLTVIGWLLQIYHLNKLRRAPIIFTDESLTAISAEYRPNFFQWVSRLAEVKGLMIVLVTHDNALMEYADRTYYVNLGNIKEVTSHTPNPTESLEALAVTASEAQID